MSSNRRLAAIMFTDIVGYSSLTQRNEELSQHLLRAHNEIIRAILPQFNGREIKTIGDAFHLEFASSLQAIQCGIKIQQAIHARNESEEDDRKFQIRVGIHLGDVMPEEGDVFGDTVNIASRVQSLANPGGVYLSEDVYLQVRNKIDTPLFRLGIGELKNIQVPVEIYRAILPWEKGSLSVVERIKFAFQKKRTRSLSAAIAFAVLVVLALTLWFTLWNKPITYGNNRIAVLPFENISPNPEEVSFVVDGMHDQMIATLSKVDGLEVIAKTSVMYFQGSQRRANEIAKELGAEILLESSVRYAGDRVRFTLQLIDGLTEKHLWTQEYDKEYNVDELFEIQSDVAKQVADSLRVVLLSNQVEQLSIPPTHNNEALNLYLRGKFLASKHDEAGLTASLERYKEALALDSNFALAYVGLAEVYNRMAGSYLEKQDALSRAESAALQALQLDDGIAGAYIQLGNIYSGNDEWDLAEESFLKALEIDPQSADAHYIYGDFIRRFPGGTRVTDGESEILKAFELDPLNVDVLLSVSGLFMKRGDHDMALNSLQTVLDLHPDHRTALTSIAIVQERLGNLGSAEQTLKEIIELNPDDVIAQVNFAVFLKNHQRFNEAVVVFEKMIEDHPEVLANHGLWHFTMILEYLGQWEYAWEVWQRRLEANPQTVLWRFAYGTSLMANGLFERAKTEFDVIVAEHPNLAFGVGTMAQFYYFREEYGEAKFHAEKAIDLDSASQGGYWFNLAKVELGLSNFELALAALDEAKKLTDMSQVDNWLHNPHQIKAMRGIVYASMGNLSNARTILDDLLSRPEDYDQDYSYNIAKLHFALGETDEGFDRLAKAHEEWASELDYSSLQKIRMVKKVVSQKMSWQHNLG